MSEKHPATEDKQSSVYRRMLLEKRESALAGLGAKAHHLAKGERISEEDQAQCSLEEAVSLRLNGLEYMQLRQIQDALDRLQLGEYGICFLCEKPIPAKRLHALPWAKYCVKCQERVADDFLEDDEALDQ
jgi:DnaK suppressor protein